MSDDASARRILLEVLVFAALFLVVGLVFAVVRAAREGDRIWTVTPHTPR